MRNTDTSISRRLLLQGGGLASAAGLAVLTGAGGLVLPTAVWAAAASSDADALNVALALEDEGIAAYQISLDSKLLQPDIAKVAQKFMDDHKDHRDDLIKAIKKLNVEPAKPKSKEEYAKALNAASLKSQKDILELAQKLELQAVNAYIGVLASFQDRSLAKVSGRIAADEVMHWTTLNATLGKPLPKAMSFGA